ncbi:MAG: Flp family type IVb pilin [Deltaproteobacteria bacterium]|nr:Flp family type IVb pilin [Deltaproteobacteria bacterium]
MKARLQKLLKRLRRDQRGQGMTEYIIIVALIAIAAIGVVTIFGDNIRDLFAASTNALAGDTQVTPGTQKAKDFHTKTKTLKTFAEKNVGSQ